MRGARRGKWTMRRRRSLGDRVWAFGCEFFFVLLFISPPPHLFVFSPSFGNPLCVSAVLGL